MLINIQMGTVKACCGISMLLVMASYLQIAEGAKSDMVGNSLLDKPKGTVKTIKTDHGDVVDCVNIYKQPSLDHPLLKNHTIQMRPTSYPVGLLERRRDASSKVFQTWSEKEECPDGTVPIRRMHKNKSISRVWRKSLPFRQTDAKNYQPFKTAAVFRRTPSRQTMSGLSANINVWNPRTEPADYSAAKLWLGYESGFNQIEVVEAGWEVNPNHYGANSTRLFVSYTNNGHKSYCYNLECPGFVQVDKAVTPGLPIFPISSYNGYQYAINVELFLDKSTKNLWVTCGGKASGYWPATLFKYIPYGANFIGWGGEVYEAPTSTHPTSTAMGSGHLPEEGIYRANYFNHMQFRIAGPTAVIVRPNSVTTFPVNTDWSLYHALPISANPEDGPNFYFGGPGVH